MSAPDLPPPGDLQFERAEFTSPAAGLACSQCGGPAMPEYYEFRSKIYCGICRQRIEQSLGQLRASGSMSLALGYGLAAAAAGFLLSWGVQAITGYQVGLIALAVGWLVGQAVRKGSGGLGGRRYQIIAVALTYVSIASSHLPAILTYFGEHAAKSGHAIGSIQFVFAFGLAMALPFLALPKGILGLFIIGIGLFEAWKFTRGVKVEFSGPFSVNAASAGTA